MRPNPIEGNGHTISNHPSPELQHAKATILSEPASDFSPALQPDLQNVDYRTT